MSERLIARPSPRCRTRRQQDVIVTSHRHDNAVVADLFRSLGFVSWDLEGIALKPSEV